MLFCQCTNLVYVTILFGFHWFSCLSHMSHIKDTKHMTSPSLIFGSFQYFISLLNFSLILIMSPSFSDIFLCFSWIKFKSWLKFFETSHYFSYKLLKCSSSVLWISASQRSVIDGLGSSGGVELSLFFHVFLFVGVLSADFSSVKFGCLFWLIWGFTYEQPICGGIMPSSTSVPYKYLIYCNCDQVLKLLLVLWINSPMCQKASRTAMLLGTNRGNAGFSEVNSNWWWCITFRNDNLL